MKCYKCSKEMFPVMDTAWRKHRDGTKARMTEFFCCDCRVWMTVKIDDYSECEILNEMLDKVEEYAREERE